MGVHDGAERSTALEVIGVALLAITGIHHVGTSSRERYLAHLERRMLEIVRRDLGAR